MEKKKEGENRITRDKLVENENEIIEKVTDIR